jgi:CRISPR-associated exonuclease Cas4
MKNKNSNIENNSDNNVDYNPLLKKLELTGTQIHYYYNCHRQLWFFSNHIQMEQESDYVYLGKIIHENSYKRENKEIEVDDKIKIDFINKETVISEIKKTDKSETSHIWQLKYYIYYLQTLKNVKNLTGKLHYPKLKKTMDVFLDENDIVEIENILNEIKKIINSDVPPIVQKMKICPKCSYYELCWI